MAKPLFSRIAIIGLGLIGSSIARAAHERRLAGSIVACDANEVSLAYARQQKFIDVAAANLMEAVKGSQLVILAAPPLALGDIAQTIAPYLAPGAIVMDVCSVKQAAIEAIAPHIPEDVEFIPAHPIAGSEQSGVQAGRGDLFEHKRVIVTPDQPLQTEAIKTAMAFWQALGARVEAMPAALHDLVYAHVSHLPQLLAFAAAGPLAAYKEDKNLQTFLRLSHSNPAMWAEIFLLNKENLIKGLDRYLDAVLHIENELAAAPTQENPLSRASGGGLGLRPPKPLGVGGRGQPLAPSLPAPLPNPPPQAGEGTERLAHTTLFPRIAASCLITTVMEAEKKAGIPFARYAGTGFADFTAPAAAPPEGDIELISGQYAVVAGVLGEYVQRLKAIRRALADDGDIRRVLAE